MMTDQNHRTPALVLSILFAALCVVFTYIAAQDLLIDGPFEWHRSTPPFIEGGIELLVVMAVMICGQVVSNRWARIALLVLPVVVYARLHAIDFSLLASLFLASGIWALGYIAGPFLGLAKIREEPEGAVACFLAGLLVFSIIIWAASLAFGLSLAQVRIISFCATAIALAFVLAGSGRNPHLAAVISGISARRSLFAAFAISLLSVIFLAILAKSNTAIDYDSMWYGLRPDRVLYGDAGIYDSLGLSTQIFFYPKLFEVLVSPLYGLGDNSTIIAFNAWMWVALLAVCSLISTRSGWSQTTRWTFLLLAGTLPAAANIAVSAKGDLLASTLMLFATHLLVMAWDTRRLDYLMLAMPAVAIGVMARLSVIPYAPFLAGMIVVLLLARRKELFIQARIAPRGLWILCIATLGLTGLVFLRTYLLTGLPTVAPGEAQRLLVDMGFSLTPPIGNSTDWDNKPLLPVQITLWKMFFTPSELPHILRYWVGNVWLALVVIAFGFLVAGARHALRDALRIGPGALALPLVVFAVFVVVLATKPFLYTGGDGNYYIYPIVCLIWALCHYIARVDRGFFGRPASLLATFVVASFSAVLFFASASWKSGTRPFMFSTLASPFDMEKANKRFLSRYRLQELGDALSSCPPHLRAAGFVQPPGSFGLPVRFQQLQELAWSSKFLASNDAFSGYLDMSGTELVILPSRSRLHGSNRRGKLVNSPEAYDVVVNSMDKMERDSEADRLADVQGFEVWSLSPRASQCFGQK